MFTLNFWVGWNSTIILCLVFMTKVLLLNKLIHTKSTTFFTQQLNKKTNNLTKNKLLFVFKISYFSVQIFNFSKIGKLRER